MSPDGRRAARGLPGSAGVRFWGRVLAGALASAVLMSACGASPTGGGRSHVNIVAGENFWGSIAGQLGGDRVSVTSVMTDPNADPHEYESNSADARAFAQADYVILNGAGYDSWGQKLLDANPVDGRKVLTVASLLGKSNGDNPHFWYDPASVEKVSDQITADLKSLDPGDASYFTQRRSAFETALQPYHDRIAAIKAKFSGRKVGSTESIFVYMAGALGLNLISPPQFMKAVGEGNDPPVNSVAQFQSQISGKQITLLVYNAQTVTALTNNLKQLASQQNIPIVGVSETMQPSNSTFQDWQYAQLLEIQNALNATAPGR
jgi:zinc/manganese transport system substrate-binding protein